MKKIINWFKELELYQIFTGIFLGFLALIFVMIPFEIYKESIIHYDITIIHVNGEEQVIHCRSYNKKDDYLYYNVNGNQCYINLELVRLWSICSVECDCNKV